DLRLRLGKARSAGEDSQRDGRVAGSDADLRDVAAPRQVEQLFLDVRFTGAEGVDFALNLHAAAEAKLEQARLYLFVVHRVHFAGDAGHREQQARRQGDRQTRRQGNCEPGGRAEWVRNDLCAGGQIRLHAVALRHLAVAADEQLLDMFE